MMNASLKQYFKLSHKITVYVPATMNVTEAIDNAEYVRKTASLLSASFGGATSTQAQGFWISNANELVRENTTMVFAYASETDLDAKLQDILNWCVILKHEMQQENIALELDGEMYFI